MSRWMNTALGFSCICLIVAVGSIAFAYVGSDPVFVPQCSFTQITAAYGPEGNIKYSVAGICNNQLITGQLAYARNHQMAEKFYYQGTQLTTTARCPSDPWITGAPCEETKVSAKGADPGPLLHHSVPLSLGVGHKPSTHKMFQDAQAHAVRPKPPGPPVNARAEMKSIRSATISWIGPDQQGIYGPYLNFIVEARPQIAGAPWTKLGGLPRHSALEYKLTVKLPPAPEGSSGWELRTCATTVFTSTCTNPVIPTIKPYVQRLGPGIDQAITAPKKPKEAILAPKSITPYVGSSSNQQGKSNAASVPLRSPGTTQATSPANNAALNPQPLPPKSIGRIQPPSPGSNAALNPQPLPPKSLRFGSIMQRGIPEGETAAEETPDGNPVSAEGSPSDSSPVETPVTEERPAP